MPIMNMACSNAVECGFATVGTRDMWLLPFLLRATPRLDLTGWSLRSEVNHHSDRAFERHTRPDPERYETRNALAQDHLSGQYARMSSAGAGSDDGRLADLQTLTDTSLTALDLDNLLEELLAR